MKSTFTLHGWWRTS
ncbi:trp operon leader peptide [Citrobacter sp.]